MPAIKGWDDLSGGRETGEIQKLGLTENQIKECNAIIHTVAATAGGIGTGLAQIPVADTVALTTLQVGMITTLAMKVFELRITEATANAIIKSATAAYVARGIYDIFGIEGSISGIMEMADMMVITKADGENVKKAL